MQLQVLNDMMKNQFKLYPVKSVMILGIAGGNGLEHIEADKIQKVYGVDINQKYLKECAKRYKNLAYIFEAVCADLTEKSAVLPHSDMVVADLLIEYIGYECFKNVVTRIAPSYVSCIIQVNTDGDFVSDSPYIHVFDDLNKIHHQIDKNGLTGTMVDIGYLLINQDERKLPNGKKLVRLDYRR